MLNRRELFEVLRGNPNVLAFAGHMHTIEHHYFDEADGFRGPEPLHLHVIATVSGSWWSGPFDDRGIPATVQRDGTPNRYHVLPVDGNRARVRYRAAGAPTGHPMRIALDSSFHRYEASSLRDAPLGRLPGSPITVHRAEAAELLVDLFDGGPRSRIVLRIDDGMPLEMTRVRPD